MGNKQENDATKASGSWLSRASAEPRLALTTAILAFLTAFISIVDTSLNLEKIEIRVDDVNEEVKSVNNRVDDIVYCFDEKVKVRIEEPQAEDVVGSKISVRGKATPHPRCQYVMIFLHSFATSRPRWMVANISTVDRNGNWSANASLEHVALNGSAELHVRLTVRPPFKPNEFLEFPPSGGVPSESVRVWRRI